MDKIEEDDMESSKPLLDYSVNAEKPFKCQICTKSFGRPYSLTRHIETHAKKLNKIRKPERLACKHCSSTFSTKTNLKNHEMVVHEMHGSEPSYHCSMCDKSFLIKLYLNRHLKRHSFVKSHECIICSKLFSDSSNLRAHLKRHERDAFTHSCEDCGKTFDKLKHLRDHSKIHKDNREISCEECGMICDNEASFRKHVTTHMNSKPYQCPTCGNVFRLKEFLRCHLKRVHKIQPDKTKSYLKLDN